MIRHPDKAPDSTAAKLSRWASVHRLLFASAALGTTILTLGAPTEVKIPPFKGE